MRRERVIWLLAVLSLVGGVWWLSVNTEWVDDTRLRGARGEALENPVYAFEQMMRRLGLHAEHHDDLDALPPAGARLVLLSGDWAVLPARAAQLQAWVKRGGHLVLTQDSDWEDSALGDWVPVQTITPAPPQPAPRAEAPKPGPAPTPHTQTELVSAPPLWGDTERVVSCERALPTQYLHADAGHAPAWTLSRYDKVHAMRLPVGQGSVTVLNFRSPIFHSASALRCDMPLLLAAAVQAEPGATVWVYLHEQREPLLPWLWHQGWITIVAGLLALAAALWRAAVRFGPHERPAPRARRSIAEQVRGLGAYLQRHGGEALLAAAQRALDEAAARALPRYRQLVGADRARAIAAATALSPQELSTAMATRFCTRAQLPARLQVLEAARRRLLRSPEERTAP